MQVFVSTKHTNILINFIDKLQDFTLPKNLFLFLCFYFQEKTQKVFVDQILTLKTAKYPQVHNKRNDHCFLLYCRIMSLFFHRAINSFNRKEGQVLEIMKKVTPNI